MFKRLSVGRMAAVAMVALAVGGVSSVYATDPPLPAITYPFDLTSVTAVFLAAAVAILGIIFPFRVGIRFIWGLVRKMTSSVVR